MGSDLASLGWVGPSKNRLSVLVPKGHVLENGSSIGVQLVVVSWTRNFGEVVAIFEVIPQIVLNLDTSRRRVQVAKDGRSF